jgi:hypothetical protein
MQPLNGKSFAPMLRSTVVGVGMETLLQDLGKIAGIAGIAVGAMVLIFRDVLTEQLGPQRAYRLRMYIVTAAFSVAVLGIIVYSAAPIVTAYVIPAGCKPGEVVSECKKRLDAVAQVQQAAKALASMQNSRGIHLSPALEAYLVNPSPENWEKVRDEAQRTLDDLTSAADAVFVYDPALLSSADLLGQIKEGLSGKARILNQIIATQSPPNMSVAIAYRDELANIMSLLDDDIKRLEHRLQQIS